MADLVVKPAPGQDVVVVAPDGYRLEAAGWRNSGHSRHRLPGAVPPIPSHGHPVVTPPPPPPDPEPEPEPEPPPVPSPTGTLWITPARLASLPTSGPAWERLRAQAYGTWGQPSFSSYTEDAAHDVMAGALVGARLNDAALKTKVIDAISVVFTDPGGADPDKATSRILPELVMSAGLVGYRTPAFEARLRQILTLTFDGPEPGPIPKINRQSPGNGGGMCGATMAAIGVYLADKTIIADAIDGLKMFTGSYPGDFRIREGRDWWYAANPDTSKYTPVNPTPSAREGNDVSGLIPVEMERGSAKWPPVHTGYPRITLNGRVVQAAILLEAGAVGADVWAWGDKALIRASAALFRLGGAFAEPEQNQNWLLNYYAAAGLPTKEPAAGRATHGVDWTHR